MYFLSFQARSASGDMQCVNVTIVDDPEVEEDETFLVGISTTGLATTIDPNTTIVTILNDDAAS